MPNVGEKSPPDNWLDLHAQSLDALVRGSAPARPYQPYPGDHPCSVCGSLLAFVAVGWPRHPQWFCRKHLEDFTCQTLPTPSICRGTTNSDGMPKWPSTSGTPSASPSSPGQLSLW